MTGATMPTIHYQFAHVTMRNLVLEDTEQIFAALSSIQKGRSVLIDLWVRTEMSLRGQSSASGLDLKRVDGNHANGEGTQGLAEWRSRSMHIGCGDAATTDLDQLVGFAYGEIRACPVLPRR